MTGPFYKFLSKDFTHHGFKYKMGLNIDTVPFSEKEECGPGGLYYASLEHIFRFIEYGPHLVEVTIPPDAQASSFTRFVIVG